MEPLLTTIALPLYLLPCAIQDWRSHQISNWLTIPAFVAAYVVAFTLGNLPLTLAVFLGCYVAWSMQWMGAADGKLTTLVAAVAPLALITSALLLGFTFLLLRLLYKRQMPLPAAVWLWLASMINAIIVSAQVPQGELTHLSYLVALPQLLAMSTALFALAFLYAQLHKLTTRFPKQQRSKPHP